MAIPTITPLSDPPRLGQDSTEFDSKADVMVSELPVMVTEINATASGIDAVATEVESDKTDAETAATTATTKAAEAQTDRIVVQSLSDTIPEAYTAAANSLSVLNFGLLDAVVIGDTDGVNKTFHLLGIGFTPSWILFSDGSKISENDFTLDGTELTLDTAPASGVEVEALGPADSQRAAPTGYKGISVATNKNGTFTGTVTGHTTTPIWRVEGQADTTTATFTYTNDGSYRYIHCFINDDSDSAVLDFEDEDIVLIDAEYDLTVSQLKFRDNVSLINARGLAAINTASGTDFAYMMRDCSSLTTMPMINTASGTNFAHMMLGCASLTTMPMINTAAGTNFSAMMLGCASLTTMPMINTAAGTNFAQMMRGCASLTTMPMINTAAGTNFAQMMRGCSSLTTMPQGMFNSAKSTDYTGAFQNCALTQQSVDDILVSIKTSVDNMPSLTNGTLDINGGTSSAPSSSGLAAKSALESAGWTVTTN